MSTPALIGIELVNPGHGFGYRRFPTDQMAALAKLAASILARHPIPSRNVVGHSDVAPLRKQDPGELFDWAGLARQGVGLWPESGRNRASRFVRRLVILLGRWGYDVADGVAAKAALIAFQRHFRPSRHDGVADAETKAKVHTLLQMVGARLDNRPNLIGCDGHHSSDEKVFAEIFADFDWRGAFVRHDLALRDRIA